MSLAGIGANVLGYADPGVNGAVIEAVKKGNSSTLNCAEEVELAELLCRLHPWAEKVRFTRTGGESMAVAVRIARSFTAKDKLMVCGYHGWHDWYLSANLSSTDSLNAHHIAGLEPKGVPKGLAGTVYPFHYNNIEEFLNIFKNVEKDLAAIIMEPIRGAPPIDGFFETIREFADKKGVLLIIDEISAGLRMNTGGAHLKLGIRPDIAVFSKALGNGFPIGAVIGKGDVMEAAQKTFISSTYWTERVGPAAALATLKKHEALDVGAHLMRIGKAVQSIWQNASKHYGVPIEISGIPPLSHFEFKMDSPNHYKALFIQLMLDKNILASNSFYSMYSHTDEHVKIYKQAVMTSFENIRFVSDAGTISQCLHGQPSTSGFQRIA